MRKPLLTLLLLSFIVTAKAQQNDKIAMSPGQSADVKQDTKPEPPEGIDALNKYMKKIANREYNNSETGSVTLSFVVEKNGSLSDYKIVHSLNKEADGVAIDVLKEYNKKWKPAMQNGQPESMPYTIVVPFGK